MKERREVAPLHLSAALRWARTRRFAAALVGMSFLALSASGLAIPRVVMFPAVPQPLVCVVPVANLHQEDVVASLTSTVTCRVTRANASDGRFSLRLHLVTPDGATNRFTVLCSGTLLDGSGTCTHAFEVPYSFAPRNSWVAGSSLPSGRTLGPVILVPVLPLITS
jgi:hypothetical protein